MKKNGILAFLIILIMGQGFSQNVENPRNASPENLKGTLAIQGYDPVAYFKQGRPIKGRPELSVAHGEATYYFSSPSNKALFIKNPSLYAPQYGGWCAYAMGASNELVEINPETFKIVDGKLYLFYHTPFVNTLKKWDQKEQLLKSRADLHWKKRSGH
ncbi:MAG: YHS domain-containing (seleno)protein [Sediminicola sp.]